MTKKINIILKEVLQEIKPSNEELKKIGSFLKKFTERLKEKISGY